MSDGPHKSLPQKPHWKKVAEYAERSAFDVDEVGHQLRKAIVREFSGVPIELIHQIAMPHPQQEMFTEHSERAAEEIERLRPEYRGEKAVNEVLDQMKLALLHGQNGDKACRQAFERAAMSTVQSHLRETREHYYRKTTKLEAGRVVARWHEAAKAIPLNVVVRDMLAGQSRSAKSLVSSKQDGLDDGPAKI